MKCWANRLCLDRFEHSPKESSRRLQKDLGSPVSPISRMRLPWGRINPTSKTRDKLILSRALLASKKGLPRRLTAQ